MTAPSEPQKIPARVRIPSAGGTEVTDDGGREGDQPAQSSDALRLFPRRSARRPTGAGLPERQPVTALDDRRELLARAQETWRGRLIDLSRNNQLLYYRSLKVGTVDLAPDAAAAIARLLRGGEVSLQDLTSGLEGEAATTVEKRFAEIRRKAIENQEERGLSTLHLAVGRARWRAPDEGRDPAAPVVLVPIERTADRQRVIVRRAGDPEPNFAMVHVLETEFGCNSLGTVLETIDPNDQPEDYPRRIVEVLLREAENVPGFGVDESAVIGNFSFQKMAMVRDLDALAPQMADNLIVAAMAGDAEAVRILASTSAPIDPSTLDHRPPDEEYGVLSADSSQQVVIAHAVQGDSGVVIGPPGTGKSQTISNVIAELTARGKAVLFVAEKRAALDAVKKRLVSVGLEHLLLDLHGSVTKKEIMEQFGKALAGVDAARPVDAAQIHEDFQDTRTALRDHNARMHTPLAPSGLTLFQVQGRLLTSPEQADLGLVFTSATRAKLAKQTLDQVVARMRELVDVADLVLGQSSSPWAAARITSASEADEALGLASDIVENLLPEVARNLTACVEDLGIPHPATLAEAQELAVLALGLHQLLNMYGRDILEEDVASLATSLAPARRRLSVRRLGRRYRRAKQKALALRREPVAVRQLLLEITEGASVIQHWQRLAGERPAVNSLSAPDLSTDLRALHAALATLDAYVTLPDLAAVPLYDVHARLRALSDDRVTPLRLARMREGVAVIEQLGFGDLLARIRSRQTPGQYWLGALHRCVWETVLAERRRVDPGLATFNGRSLDDVVRRFVRSDEDRIEVAAARVRRSHAGHAVQVMNSHPEQVATLRRQAQLKTRHKSLRQLMADASETAVALKPCWMASPLAVSQLLGGGRTYFDVVIFDEASQVQPEDAVPALMRGRAAIVAGDPRQLPPTRFFASHTDADEAADEGPATDLSGFESVLDLLASTFQPWNLEWHYRSKDERLIAFSNEYIYDRRLVTFPSPGLDSPVRHVLVAKSTGDADEDSPAQEVEAVAQLVLEHAHRTDVDGGAPSLGVITMGLKHARRVEARIEQLRATDRVLDAFIAQAGAEPFFVKNLERVQGDERRCIILSVGYGKDVSGRLPYRFGPLLQQGGERRLNVAITRASHEMTVVSSFGHHDMPPEKSKAEGVRLLRAYLEYMADDGMTLVHEGTKAYDINAFEHDVASALQAVGIDVVPQYGVSRYCIDMVTKHPRHDGVLVLAVECDGATYHSSPTARDRDRLRQQHLEALGWRFCRIWSTDWFLERRSELDRVVAAHVRRVAELDGEPVAGHDVDNIVPLHTERMDDPLNRAPRPHVRRGLQIAFYHPSQLDAIVTWIRSDGQLRTDDDLLREAMDELGFQRRGRSIEMAIRAAIDRTRQTA